MSSYNVDVKLTDAGDPNAFQFINMNISAIPPGATQLRGYWRGASAFIPSSGGEFDWDGRPGQEVAFIFDGPSSDARLVLDLQDFISPQGGLPEIGATGGGNILDPNTPTFLGNIHWEIT
ncbi:hypothetical protein ACWCXH_38935 [Kitasatospora sp. NPDC001660]